MNTMNYYLKKGFDKRTAEYFASGRKKITKVIAEEGYVLKLWFDNGEQRLLDFSAIIETGSAFSFLKDEENFKRVYLDENSNVAWDIDPRVNSREVWNNKVDLSSDTCYLDSVPVLC